MPGPPQLRKRNLLLGGLLGLVVAGAGVVEDLFGRLDYAGDAIAYLDLAKAIGRGDWHLAVNPYWSSGYPLLLAAVRWMFPLGPEGEWTTVHVVNLMLFLGTYASFLWFLEVARRYRSEGEVSGSPAPAKGPLFVTGTGIFLTLQISIGNVSRVSPDLAVSGVFLLLIAAVLSFCMNPQVKSAVRMGVLMGAGYWLKMIFLPLSLIIGLVVLLHLVIHRSADRKKAVARLAWAPLSMAVVTLPYLVALSLAFGTFTLGESGRLNYAWNVNGLPHWTDWQGGSALYGTPIHPPRLVGTHPPVFAFGPPSALVTYSPWFYPVYAYDGYRHFFRLANQSATVRYNLHLLRSFLLQVPLVYAFIPFLVAGLLLIRHRKRAWPRLLTLWPLYLPAFAGMAIYLLVYIEPRYIVGFLIVLETVPFLLLFAPTPLLSKKAGYALVALTLFCHGVSLVQGMQSLIHRAGLYPSHATTEQWRTGLFLARTGGPGLRVARVGRDSGMLCTWAHIGDARIVAEIGNDAYDPDDQDKDFRLFVEHPEVQQSVFKLFRQAGATLVIALDVKEPLQGPGWEQIPETHAWVHRLSEVQP